MKWFPGDLRREPGYRTCSLSARGLWREMLDIMWHCPERGVLKAGEKVWGAKEIAMEVGAPFTEVEKDLAELYSAGIYSIREDGSIFNRRMCHEEKQRQQVRQRVQKYRDKHSSVTRNGSVTLEKSEVRSQKSEKAEAACTAETAATAFSEIGFDSPFGQRNFQSVWVANFKTKKPDQWLTPVMEATIQQCQERRIGVPPQFYDAKRDVEKQEKAQWDRKFHRTPL